MMKLTALYTPPSDPAAFDEHYTSVHIPMVDTLPGLVRQETAVVAGTPDGSPAAYHRQADLYFEDSAALNAAFASDAGRATARDAAQLAARTGSTITFLVSQVERS
jgi:uncharacterized protein (TIGR02118 family)